MSVYTVVSLATVQSFAQKFNLNVIRITPIQNGIENSNYFVTLADGRELVLTLFEELGAADAAVLSRLMARMADHGILVAVPLADTAGVRLHTLANKPAQLAPRLPGASLITPNVAQVAQMGAGLAHLHLALEHDPLPTEQTLTVEYNTAWWVNAKEDVIHALSHDDQALMNRVFDLYADIKQRFPTLPQGLIHGDVFRDNTLFVDDQLSAILDFSTVAHDDWLMDLAITINDFCTNYPDVTLAMDRVASMVEGYSDVRKLSDQEKMALQTYLVMAACRFWVLRLQVAQRNEKEGRASADILQKDPDEMRRMMLDRLQKIV